MLPGSVIDRHQAAYIKTVSAIRAKIRKLERQGVHKAFPHFKKGTKTMYLLDPTDGSGKRKYTYIGADPKDQEKALGKIRRHQEREALKFALTRLSVSYRDLQMSVGSCMARMKDLDAYAKKCLTNGNAAAVRIRPSGYHEAEDQDDDF